MDCLDPNVPLDLYDPKWKIYSRNPVLPPHYAGPNSKIENSMVAEGCDIEGETDFSVLFDGVVIEEGATVRYSIIMPNTIVKKGAVIEYSIVGEECTIGEGAHIGERPENVENRDEWGVAVVGNAIKISDNAVIAPKAMISQDV
jgi:glucose-1-phosphate adenylyltransferase